MNGYRTKNEDDSNVLQRTFQKCGSVYLQKTCLVAGALRNRPVSDHMRFEKHIGFAEYLQHTRESKVNVPNEHR